jgi:ribosome-binding protein aMBF1 (putative translation factor)
MTTEARMDKNKRRRLQAAGWKVGSVGEFLGLTAAEEQMVELRASLAAELQERRNRAGLTQAQLAARLKSSQSRVAKMEAGDPTVSLDLLVRALFVIGTTPRQLASAIDSRVA